MRVGSAGEQADAPSVRAKFARGALSTVAAFEESELSADQVLGAGAGAGKVLAATGPEIARWLKIGGKVLAIGLDETDASAFLPFRVTSKRPEQYLGKFLIRWAWVPRLLVWDRQTCTIAIRGIFH